MRAVAHIAQLSSAGTSSVWPAPARCHSLRAASCHRTPNASRGAALRPGAGSQCSRGYWRLCTTSAAPEAAAAASTAAAAAGPGSGSGSHAHAAAAQPPAPAALAAPALPLAEGDWRMAGVPQRLHKAACGSGSGSSNGGASCAGDRSGGTSAVGGGGGGACSGADSGDESDANMQTDPTAHAAALCRVLGLPAPRLMALVGRCPDLFAFSPAALEATLEAVAALTGLQRVVVPQLVAADPRLLLQPDRLKANIRELGQVLQVPTTEVINMAAREPAVLALGGAEAAARLEALAAALLLAGRPALPLRHSQLVEAVLAAPGALLAPPPETVHAQLESLEAALAPLLPAAELEAVSARLEPPPPVAAVAATAAPAAPAAVDAAEAASGASTPEAAPAAGAVASPPAGAPAAAAASASTSSTTSSSTNSSASHSPAPAAAAAHVLPLRALTAPLVLSKPSLLTTPPELLAGRVAHLAAKARLSAAQVLLAAPAGPNLLAASSCHVDRHCAAMAASLGTALRFPPPPPPPDATDATPAATSGVGAGSGAGYSRSGRRQQQQPLEREREQQREREAVEAYHTDPEAAAAAALVAEPRLLGQHVNAVAVKWQLLAAIGATSQAWSARLKAASVAERAELLVAPYTAVARLRFLADRELQDDIDLVSAVRLSDALFHIQFPAFREWLRS
ncbi:hypothetical protein HXX76_007495 [Chlamydomonas incerta]|uniref:Uncharacterized protein n=1 Tax=Chlamydomonas incerta TaxID=51695 RepID=A0A835TAQ8_CHLIN|nr:hypothetical protein HXX76_007495 [Chlamydomonas incerta]|eukprot:KAG2434600.1 hypothetical protein HXX76_007495 [Chlamydomonas incerta]